MENIYMRLAEKIILYVFPILIFIFLFPLDAFFGKFIIAKDISKTKIEKAVVILPLYSSYFLDGIGYIDTNLYPLSKIKILGNIESKNLLLSYQGFQVDFKEGFGDFKGNLEKINFSYKAYGEDNRLNLKGVIFPKERSFSIKGNLKLKNLSFPISYKGKF